MRIFSFLITLLLTIGFVQAKPKKCNKSKEQTSIVKPIILQDLSTNIHPADDFFEYVNAKWIQNNPIPSDKTSWGAFDLLQEKSTTAVKKIIDHATKSKAPKGSNLQILGDFFKSGMDTNAINKAGITPLLPYIEIINNAKDKQSIGKMLGLLQVRDINTPFGFYISQDAKNSEKYITYITQSGLGMPDKDYYLRTDEKSEKLKTAYKNYIQKIFELGGKNNIKQCVQDVWETELLLANASMSRVEQRDPIKTYNKFTIKELKNQYKNIDWDIMFNAMQFPKIDEIIVEQVDYLKTYDSLLQVIPQTQWQNYLYFQLVNSLSRYLSSNYVNARFDFYGKVLSGQVAMEPRWKRISNIANNYLRDVIGQEYVKENFSVSAKNRSLELIKNIKAETIIIVCIALTRKRDHSNMPQPE